jgi:hypothetical protein
VIRRLTPAEDEGSILILALFFLTAIVFLVIIPLSYADTNLRASVSLKQQARLQATADGALDDVIDAFRSRTDQGTAFQGTPGAAQPCPWTASPNWSSAGFSLPFALNGWTVGVSCIGLVPSTGSVTGQRRDVVFTVTCLTPPAASTCPSTSGPLLRARVLFFDEPTFDPQVTVVKSWSEDF